jgi:predicted aldo/keto reductase-like oxidoreductase
MIRYAIDKGVNYVDTAFPYAMGGSERVVGKALLDGYRAKTRIATKLSPSVLKSPQDFDGFLNVQLKRLRTNKIDNYLLHGLNEQTWRQLRDWKAIQWVERKIAEGKIGCLGFSFHDSYAVFRQIVDYYDNWAFCQVQYNYLDEDYQAGRKGVEYAAGKGLGIVVMEPLRGGQLAGEPPAAAAQLWNENSQRSPVEWALDWLWNQPEISVVLSGMSTIDQVVQNVTYAGRSGPGSLSDADLSLCGRVREAYQSVDRIPCTGCQYCQPCPNGVLIPRIFEIYNEISISREARTAATGYSGPGGLKEEQRADRCQECGECVKVCPQKIQVPAELKRAHDALTQVDEPLSRPITARIASMPQRLAVRLGGYIWRWR